MPSTENRARRRAGRAASQTGKDKAGKMKYLSVLKSLVPLIGLLALFAAAMGLFDATPGQPYPYTNHRGETVTINGRGLYYYDTLSTAAQMQGNDLVTLLVGLPLLAASTWLALRGSLRGRLLLTGTLGFFLYTYMSMSMLTAYNALFLVYVALFSLSLIAFVVSLLSFDVQTLPGHFSAHLPRGLIAGLLYLIGGFLLLAWLGRIVTPLLQNQTPALENTTTLVIQTMDLGLIVPLEFLAGLLLLRRSPYGYLLASVALMKGLTMGLGVSAMAVNMALRGVPDSPAIILMFFFVTLLNLIMAVLLLRNVDARPAAPRTAPAKRA
jgi:hypothetical protein